MFRVCDTCSFTTFEMSAREDEGERIWGLTRELEEFSSVFGENSLAATISFSLEKPDLERALKAFKARFKRYRENLSSALIFMKKGARAARSFVSWDAHQRLIGRFFEALEIPVEMQKTMMLEKSEVLTELNMSSLHAACNNPEILSLIDNLSVHDFQDVLEAGGILIPLITNKAPHCVEQFKEDSKTYLQERFV